MERDADRLAQYHTGRKHFFGNGINVCKISDCQKIAETHTHYVTADWQQLKSVVPLVPTGEEPGILRLPDRRLLTLSYTASWVLEEKIPRSIAKILTREYWE